MKTVMTRITPEDLEWLRQRAEKNHRTAPQEISAIREILTALDVSVLPHPQDATPVPVITLKE